MRSREADGETATNRMTFSGGESIFQRNSGPAKHTRRYECMRSRMRGGRGQGKARAVTVASIETI
jgi:hypothetical protein